MAVAWTRLRMFWGALDIEREQGTSPGYGPTQIVSGGTDAAIASGVGVRRASLEIDRSTQNALLDPAYVHFDFLNTTAGAPDDTWIVSDFSALETALQTFMTSMKPYTGTMHKLTRIIWHRVGTGVGKPNPAERVLVLGTPIPGSFGNNPWPSQVAMSITFKTGVRRSWGRTYWPVASSWMTDGTFPTAACDAVAGATNTLVNSAASSDFHLVVVSDRLSSSLNVEQVQVDNVADIIRRRRLKKKTYAKVLP